MSNPLDVWDSETFDEDLISILETSADLIRSYITVDHNIENERRESPLTAMLRSNPYWDAYQRLLEHLTENVKRHVIRAWHYSRLTDSEVAALLANGIHLSTKDTARRRLDEQVAAQLLSAEIAEAIFKASPLHDRQQTESRSNRFWMTSHPVQVEDDGVALLLQNWGGEVLYFWLQDAYLQATVANIGTARVLEVAVPLDALPPYQLRSASESIVTTFARSLDCVAGVRDFDLSAIRPLGPDAVRAVHSAGEIDFERIGKGYPANFRPEL